MKKNKNNNLMQSVLRAGVCLFALSGANALMAQTDGVAPAVANDSIAKVKKEAPKYKMKEVKGVIYDGATHKPMSGVMVAALNNPAYSALTNEDGSYTLSVPYFVHALYVNAPDYNPIQIPVKRKGNVDGYLHSNKFKGFYKDGTTITAQNTVSLDNTSALSVETEIQNQLAGDVRSINRNGTPAQGAYMMIRGIHSLNTNNQPLIVLDGNMIDMQEDRTALHQGFVNNVLSGLDPEDIESIQVLKNGTALYGAKGANGVILINTKRGKSMATKINVDIYGGVVLKPQTIDMMKAEEFRSFLGDMLGESNKGLPSLSYVPFLNQDPDYFWYPMFHNETDWDEEMYRTTMTQNYKVSVEGGDEIAMYNLSLGYSQANSAMKNNDFNRLNLRFNTDIKIAEKLHTQLDIAYSRMAYNILDNGWAENYDDQNIAATNVLGLVQTPFLSKYGYYIGTDGKLHQNKIYAGKYAAESNLYDSPNMDNPFNYASSVVPGENTVLNNPYWILENGKGEEKNFAELTQFNINVMPKWQITKQLSLTNRFNYALSRNNEKYYVPVNGSSPYALENLGEITSVLKSQFTKQTTINNDLRLNWGETYGAHDINIFGGWRYNNYSYSYSYLKGYNNTNDKMPILNYGRQYLQYSGTNDNWSDMAYYANVDYNLRNRYFIQASVAAQASSRFGSNTEQGFQLAGVSWGVFPSVQLGWLISSESWFPKTKGINYLKLTAGYDMSGNDNIDYYAASTYWSSEKYLKESIGLVMQNIDNPKIQWETTTQYNVGLEGSFLNNRLQAGLNLFWSNTDHLLVKEKVSYLTGLEDYWTNNGAMKNAGFEVSANAALVNRRNWKWQVGATVGHYKNEITKLPSSDVLKIKDEHGNVVKTINGYTSSIYGEDNVLTAVGHAAGVFYGFQTAGVFASDADAKCHTNKQTGEKEYLKYPTGLTDANQAYKTFGAGDMHFVDQNGDGIINDADKVIIGDPNPDIYGNIYTMLNYKRLTLNVNLRYSLGNDVYNYQRSQIEGGNSFYNQSSAMVNRWTHEGQVTDIPRACYPLSDNWLNNERFSDRWIEDGSYLKIKNIRLTYDIPVSSTWLQGVKVWGEANDVFTLTKYLGTDPEISASNNILYQGIDNGMMPLTRSFNIGVSLNL